MAPKSQKSCVFLIVIRYAFVYCVFRSCYKGNHRDGSREGVQGVRTAALLIRLPFLKRTYFQNMSVCSYNVNVLYSSSVIRCTSKII